MTIFYLKKISPEKIENILRDFFRIYNITIGYLLEEGSLDKDLLIEVNEFECENGFNMEICLFFHKNRMEMDTDVISLLSFISKRLNDDILISYNLDTYSYVLINNDNYSLVEEDGTNTNRCIEIFSTKSILESQVRGFFRAAHV